MRIGVPKEDQGPRVSRRHDARQRARGGGARPRGATWSAMPRRGRASPTRTTRDAGAKILPTAAEVFAAADLIVKVKEPQPAECAMLREGQTLFTYLHLAPDPEQAKALMASGVTAIAYETVTSARGGLPLLAPMSEVAGRMAIQAGAHCLEMEQGGRGMLLGGAAGVAPAKVVVLGGGVSGVNAVRMGIGLEAQRDRARHQCRPALRHRPAVRRRRQHHLLHAPGRRGLRAGGRSRHRRGAGAGRRGAQAHHRATGQGACKRGSVLVDISIDQGGCSETSRPTTHAEPTYIVHDVVHYCVANMPGAVARTSTFRAQQRHAALHSGAGRQGPRGAP